MVSVTQRITQYNKQHGQPRSGLIKPSAMTCTTLDDEHGVLNHTIENLHASVGTTVDYLARLARVRVSREEFSDTVRDDRPGSWLSVVFTGNPKYDLPDWLAGEEPEGA